MRNQNPKGGIGDLRSNGMKTVFSTTENKSDPSHKTLGELSSGEAFVFGHYNPIAANTNICMKGSRPTDYSKCQVIFLSDGSSGFWSPNEKVTHLVTEEPVKFVKFKG